MVILICKKNHASSWVSRIIGTFWIAPIFLRASERLPVKAVPPPRRLIFQSNFLYCDKLQFCFPMKNCDSQVRPWPKPFVIFCELCRPQGKYILNISSIKQITHVRLMNCCSCPVCLQTQLAKTFPRRILLFVSVQSLKPQLNFIWVYSYVSAAHSCWHLTASQDIPTPLPNQLWPAVSTWPVCQCSAKHQVKTERGERKTFYWLWISQHPKANSGRKFEEDEIHHLWLDVGVAVEQWWDGEQEWLPEKVVSVSLRITCSVAETFLEIYCKTQRVTQVSHQLANTAAAKFSWLDYFWWNHIRTECTRHLDSPWKETRRLEALLSLCTWNIGKGLWHGDCRRVVKSQGVPQRTVVPCVAAD